MHRPERQRRALSGPFPCVTPGPSRSSLTSSPTTSRTLAQAERLLRSWACSSPEPRTLLPAKGQSPQAPTSSTMTALSSTSLTTQIGRERVRETGSGSRLSLVKMRNADDGHDSVLRPNLDLEGVVLAVESPEEEEKATPSSELTTAQWKCLPLPPMDGDTDALEK